MENLVTWYKITFAVRSKHDAYSLTRAKPNPFAPELPVTARADPRPFYPL